VIRRLAVLAAVLAGVMLAAAPAARADSYGFTQGTACVRASCPGIAWISIYTGSTLADVPAGYPYCTAAGRGVVITWCGAPRLSRGIAEIGMNITSGGHRYWYRLDITPGRCAVRGNVPHVAVLYCLHRFPGT
jgi:hypothetical protein